MLGIPTTSNVKGPFMKYQPDISLMASRLRIFLLYIKLRKLKKKLQKTDKEDFLVSLVRCN